VLISPFDIGTNSKDSDLCMLANKSSSQESKSTSLHFRFKHRRLYQRPISVGHTRGDRNS
jgi:hypothetical protein